VGVGGRTRLSDEFLRPTVAGGDLVLAGGGRTRLSDEFFRPSVGPARRIGTRDPLFVAASPRSRANSTPPGPETVHRPDHVLVLRAIAISALLVGLTPGVARGTAWQWPVSGRIVGTFSFSPADPYAAGQRRGIVIAAVPGAPVRSVCTGRVAFSGSVGRVGSTVSVQCGALRATYQGLGEIYVAQSAFIAAGDHIARVGARAALRLGARKGPGAYVDPASLLAERVPPLGPAPRAVRPGPAPPATGRRHPPPATGRRPASPRRVLPATVSRPRATPAPKPATPLLAWAGLAAILAAVGPLPVLVVRRRTRRGRARRPAPSPASR